MLFVSVTFETSHFGEHQQLAGKLQNVIVVSIQYLSACFQAWQTLTWPWIWQLCNFIMWKSTIVAHVCLGGTLSCQHFIRILTSSLFGTVIEIKLHAICISHLISTICHSFSFGTSGPFETNMTDIQIWFAVFSEGFTLLMFVCKWQPCILKVFAYVVHVRGCRVHWQRWSMCSHWKSTEYEQVFLMKRRQ